jgi:hypothetical protein|tara:strand:+ start:1459 stop:3087 length:1629 start_codon:yes stop_codon:yes gene_type:complete
MSKKFSNAKITNTKVLKTSETKDMSPLGSASVSDNVSLLRGFANEISKFKEASTANLAALIKARANVDVRFKDLLCNVESILSGSANQYEPFIDVNLVKTILRALKMFEEVLTADDIIDVAAGKNFYDSLDAPTDNFYYVSQFVRSPIEELITTEELSFGVNKEISSTVSSNELISIFQAKNIFDFTGTVIDSIYIEPRKVLGDSVSATSNIELLFDASRQFNDNVTTLSNITFDLDASLDDSLDIFDSTSLNVDKTFTDSISPTGIIALTPNKGITSTVGTVETYFFDIDKSLNDDAFAIDLVAVPDGVTFQLTKSATSIITVVDEYSADFDKSLSDSLAVFDGVNVSSSKIFNESLSTTEVLSIDITKLLNNMVTVVDNIVLLYDADRIISDSIISGDSITSKDISKSLFGDSTLTSDSIITLLSAGKSIFDIISILENIVLGLDKGVVDGVNAADAYVSHLSKTPLVDTTTASDFIVIFVGLSRVINDIISALDEVILNVDKSINELTVAADSGVALMQDYVEGFDYFGEDYVGITQSF